MPNGGLNDKRRPGWQPDRLKFVYSPTIVVVSEDKLAYLEVLWWSLARELTRKLQVTKNPFGKRHSAS